MNRGHPTVVVTGMGLLTCLGEGTEANWRRLLAGESGIRPITRFPADGLKTTFAGTVDFVTPPGATIAERAEAMANRTITEALAQAGMAEGAFPGPLLAAVPPTEIEWASRAGLAAGLEGRTPTYAALLCSAEDPRFAPLFRHHLVGSIAADLAARFGTTGSPISLSTACASGATAIQLGLEAIRRGESQAALVVGTDSSVTAETLIRFSLLAALSTRNEAPQAALRPFNKDRDGFVMAEGAAALVLETVAHARARGAAILGVVAGAGDRADSFHRTRSSPDGGPIIACMREAIADAGLTPDDIGYVNAHGTGTPENDKMEWLGLAAVFGERASRLPVSSTKSMIGHTLSAAGAIEAVVTFLALRDGILPPTIGYDTPDPAIPIDCVPNTARPTRVRHALSNSFGFGGQNVSVVLGAAEAAG